MWIIFDHIWLTNFKFCIIVIILFSNVFFSFGISPLSVLHGVSILFGVFPILIFLYCFHNICCSYLGGVAIPLLDCIQTSQWMGILCHCCWEIYCNNNMQTVRGHPIPDHWILRTWGVFVSENYGHYCSWITLGMEQFRE